MHVILGAGRALDVVPRLFVHVQEARFTVHAAFHVSFQRRPAGFQSFAAGFTRCRKHRRRLAHILLSPDDVAAQKPGVGRARIALAGACEVPFGRRRSAERESHLPQQN